MLGNRILQLENELNEELGKLKAALLIHFDEELIVKNIEANNKAQRQKLAREKMVAEYQSVIGKAKTPLACYKAVLNWCRNKADDGLNVVREAFEKRHRMLATDLPANKNKLLSQYLEKADKQAIAFINELIQYKDNVKSRQKEEKAKHNEALLDAQKVYALCKSEVNRVITSTLHWQDDPVRFNKELKRIKRVADDLQVPTPLSIPAFRVESHTVQPISLTEYKQRAVLTELDRNIAAYRQELANESPITQFLNAMFSSSRARRMAALEEYEKTVKKGYASLSEQYKAACVWLDKQSQDEDFKTENNSRFFHMCLAPLADSRIEEAFTTATPNYLVRAAQLKRHQVRINTSNETHRQTLQDLQKGITQVSDRHRQLQTMVMAFKEEINKIDLSSPTAVIHTNQAAICTAQAAMEEMVRGVPEKIAKAEQVAVIIAGIDRHIDKKAFDALRLSERIADFFDEPKAMDVIHAQVQKQLVLAKDCSGSGHNFNFIGMEVLGWLVEVAGSPAQKHDLTHIQHIAGQRAHQTHDIRLDEKVIIMVQTLEKELRTGKLHKKLDQNAFKTETLQVADLARKKRDKRLEDFVARIMGGSLSATLLNVESANRPTVEQTLSPQQATTFITHFGTSDQQKAWHERFLPQLLNRAENTTTFAPRG
jgi:hypothetical protein